MSQKAIETGKDPNMGTVSDQKYFLVCPICANQVPLADRLDQDVVCDQCGEKVQKAKPDSPAMTLIFSLTAMIFYIPANMFPFMTIELYGNRSTSTIWGGIVSLMEAGSVAIAIIVLLASLVIPFFKLAILFYLSFRPGRNRNPKFKTRLYHIVEAIGRWSMLDIFLLAVLVAIMKLGPWTTVEPQVGALMFAMVVIFTMLASAYFDPQLLWKDKK